MNPFVEASLVLERRGWMRNPPLNGPKMCIGMALDKVVPAGLRYDHYNFLMDYFNERYGSRTTHFGIIDVNDRIIETEREAIATLREVARRWETAGGSAAREETSQ